MEVLIFISIIIGIALLIYAMSLSKDKPDDEAKIEKKELDELLNIINKTIEDADAAMDEMNKLSENILQEVNAKYQELLYLYNLIEEKQNTPEPSKFDILINNDFRQGSKNNTSNHPKPKDKNTVSKKREFAINSPKFEKIMELKNKGKSQGDIAKELGIGQGEVKLILEIGKDRS